MNAMNLLTLMYGSGQLQNAQGQTNLASTQMPELTADGKTFMMMLQQQMIYTGSQSTVDRESPEGFLSLLDKASQSADPQVLDLLKDGSNQQSSQAMPVSAGEGFSIGALFDALIDSLRSVLDAGSNQIADSKPVGNVAGIKQSATELTVVANGQNQASRESASLLPDIVNQLINTWQEVIAQMNEVFKEINESVTELQKEGYQIVATRLTLTVEGRINPSMPWSPEMNPEANQPQLMIGQPVEANQLTQASPVIVTATQGATDQAMIQSQFESQVQQANGPMVTADSNSGLNVVKLSDGSTKADEPASILWFKNQGIISDKTANHPGADDASVLTNKPSELTVNNGQIVSSKPLTEDIVLPDGNRIKVTLVNLADQPKLITQPLNEQNYQVTLQPTDSDSVALSGELSVIKLDPSQLPGVAKPGMPSEMPMIDAADEFMPMYLGNSLPESDAIIQVEYQSVSDPVIAVDKAQLRSSQSIESQVIDFNQQSTIAVQSDEAQKTVSIPALDLKQAVEQVKTGRSGLISTPSVKVSENPENVDVQPINKPLTMSELLAMDKSDVELGGIQRNPELITVDPQPIGREATPGATTSTDGLMSQAVPVPSSGVIQEATQPTLMQFSTQQEIMPYTGLDYLEMAREVVERVSQAKTWGDGLYLARLNLNPPNLGKMFVNISVRGQAVALQIAVASNVPKEQLKDSLNALKESLEDSGLYVVEMIVEQVESNGDGQGNQKNGNQDQTPDEQIKKSTPRVGGSVKTTPSIESGVSKSTPMI